MTSSSNALSARQPLAIHVDPYANAVLENPHEMYRIVREAGPVAYLTHFGRALASGQGSRAMGLAARRSNQGAGGLQVRAA